MLQSNASVRVSYTYVDMGVRNSLTPYQIYKLKGDLDLWYQRGGINLGGGPKILGAAYEPQ